MKTIEQLKFFFHQKMSHIISLKVTKFQQPLLITLRVADKKPEGGKKPPREIGLRAIPSLEFMKDLISIFYN